MASQKKKLQNATAKFTRENFSTSRLYTVLLKSMARVIKNTGAPEVVVGIKNGVVYSHANV